MSLLSPVRLHRRARARRIAPGRGGLASWRPCLRGWTPAPLLVLLVLILPFSGPVAGRAAGQVRDEIRVMTPEGLLEPGIALEVRDGVITFPARELTRLGWTVRGDGDRWLFRRAEVEGEVEIRAGTPFLRWGSEGVHLAHAPQRRGSDLVLPLQFLVDVLPWKLPRTFYWDEPSGTLSLLDPAAASSPGLAARVVSRSDPVRVVVIDAGHGGRDPGARGPGGTSEKDIAMGIATELARILRAQPNLEVHLTRDRDELIPLWQRGELATTWKEDRHGVFVSIHANALPNSRSTRGFETYFLSEARTEHERRVAALENAAMELEDRTGVARGDPDLGFILTELRNLDHQHWSALLAELTQEELAKIHPGPNRGVKQGPLAVITNALMPAVLVEVGFITNPEEERLLRQKSFQEDAAEAVAKAVVGFFRRYPPVTGGDDGRGESGP